MKQGKFFQIPEQRTALAEMVSPGTPRVTLGVPVYNGERYLEAALESLLAQTYRNFELVISDNASADATESICRAYTSRDDRIRYYPQQ